VEDERIVALDITMTLRRLGYEISGSVGTGEDAIVAALAFDKHPDVVLMDIRLDGDMDGVAASEAIMKSLDVPIIYLTAHSDDETLRRVQRSNPYSYLLKPFRTDELRCAIEITLNRHAVDRELRVQEKWLRSTLNAMHDGVVTTDKDHTIKYVNPTAMSMTGFPTAEAIGLQLGEVVSLVNLVSRDAVDLAKDISRLSETAVVSVAGDEWPVEPSATTIAGDRGKCLGRVVVLRDISETHKALKEIERLNASLEAMVEARTGDLRIANMDLETFSYALAHDLRSPLRAIDGYIQSVQEDYGTILGSECLERLTSVRDLSQRTSRLIDELLQIARMSQTKPSPESVDLSSMATEIGRELQMAYRVGVRFVVQTQLIATADRALVHVILANLLGNAWKFSSGRHTPVIEFGASISDGKPTSYFVRDNGVGFDPNRVGDMMGMFQRAHGHRFPGDGIGLALVDRAVKRMHGTLWAEAEPEKGATFFFTLDPDHILCQS